MAVQLRGVARYFLLLASQTQIRAKIEIGQRRRCWLVGGGDGGGGGGSGDGSKGGTGTGSAKTETGGGETKISGGTGAGAGDDDDGTGCHPPLVAPQTHTERAQIQAW